MQAGAIFPTRTGSPIIFARIVHHPGYAGTGFIERIMAQANVEEVFRRSWAGTT